MPDSPQYCNARLIHKKRLNSANSTKFTYHLEFEVDSHFYYECGDSVAIMHQNPICIVTDWLEWLDKENISLSPLKYQELIKCLKTKIELNKVSSKTLKNLSELSLIPYEELSTKLIHNTSTLSIKEALRKSSLLDLIQLATSTKRSISIDSSSLQQIASKLAVRYYSIASSPTAEINRLILTVALLREKTPRPYLGSCSHYLCEDLNINETISIKRHPSRHFLLPEKNKKETNLILIGPGTGIAPFRSFLLERAQQKSNAQHWLFFGERNEKYDYYYKDTWSSLQKKINLKISTAFSRDSLKKHYIQDRIWQERDTFWRCLVRGDLIYLCGGKEMAKDVENTLIKIATEKKVLSNDLDGKTWLRQLIRSRQLLKDVY